MPEGGQQEIDFVEWASNLNNKHPIAKAYQDLRKSHFKKLRKEQALQDMQKKRLEEQAAELIEKRRASIGAKLPQSLSRKQSEPSPVQSKSPKVRKHVLKAFVKRDNMSRKSELLSQVRKHATLFDKVSEMQKSIVATSSVGTNLVYQMIESSSQLAKASLENRSTSSLLNTSNVLKPASNADITNLRTRYLDRCAQKNKVATFATESVELRKSAPDYRSALL